MFDEPDNIQVVLTFSVTAAKPWWMYSKYRKKSQKNGHWIQPQDLIEQNIQDDAKSDQIAIE